MHIELGAVDYNLEDATTQPAMNTQATCMVKCQKKEVSCEEVLHHRGIARNSGRGKDEVGWPRYGGHHRAECIPLQVLNI